MFKDKHEVVQYLEEIEGDVAKVDKSGGYAFLERILSWLHQTSGEERDLIITVLLEQFAMGGPYAWTVPWLVSRLGDAGFVQRVMAALPMVKLQDWQERQPHLYDIALVNLLSIDECRTSLIPLFHERVEELLSREDGYALYMLWLLWISDGQQVSDFVLRKLTEMVNSSVLQRRPSLLDHWLFVLCDPFSPDYAKLSRLFAQIAQCDVEAAKRLLEKMLRRLDDNPLLAANCGLLKRFLQDRYGLSE